MPVFEKLKDMLFGEDSSSYELTLQETKDSLNKLIEEYNSFVGLQEEFKKNPSFILSTVFEKKEKYTEIMDKIRYKDVGLVKEYELYAMKYNILVELYDKLKNYIGKLGQNLIVDFKVDKYKQPVAVLSQYNGDINKILLVKNTLPNQDYLNYSVGNNIEITDICSKEPNVHHGTFMVEALLNTVKGLEDNISKCHEIIVSKELVNKVGFQNCIAFFKRHGFEVKNGILTKEIE